MHTTSPTARRWWPQAVRAVALPPFLHTHTHTYTNKHTPHHLLHAGGGRKLSGRWCCLRSSILSHPYTYTLRRMHTTSPIARKQWPQAVRAEALPLFLHAHTHTQHTQTNTPHITYCTQAVAASCRGGGAASVPPYTHTHTHTHTQTNTPHITCCMQAVAASCQGGGAASVPLPIEAAASAMQLGGQPFMQALHTLWESGHLRPGHFQPAPQATLNPSFSSPAASGHRGVHPHSSSSGSSSAGGTLSWQVQVCVCVCVPSPRVCVCVSSPRVCLCVCECVCVLSPRVCVCFFHVCL